MECSHHVVPTNAFGPTPESSFETRLLDMLNDAALGLMISVGHRTKLFDVLSREGASSSASLAAASGLQERYVREWLHALATGGIVTYDEVGETFTVPPEHAAFLTRAASPSNLAVSFQFLSILGAVETEVVEAFATGGGVPYDAFPRFHEVMAEESSQTVVSALVDTVLPKIPEVFAALERGIEVLDVGCGSGKALCSLAERFPNSRFTGYDLSEEAIENARTRQQERGLHNLRFEVRDVESLRGDESYDLVTGFDVIHDQGAPGKVLEEIHRVLREGGTFLMQDVRASSHLRENLDHPLAPFLYTISTMHCMTVSLAQGGAGLGTCWGEELALAMLRLTGFEDVEVMQLPHDMQNNWYVTRKVA